MSYDGLWLIPQLEEIRRRCAAGTCSTFQEDMALTVTGCRAKQAATGWQ